MDYGLVSNDEALLEDYLAEVARVSPDSHPHLFPTEPDRLAYWINAHNACALRGVLRFNRPASLKELAHRFDSETTYVVGGKNLSLNAMTSIAYKRYTDARVHFALVKARRGGPPFRRKPGSRPTSTRASRRPPGSSSPTRGTWTGRRPPSRWVSRGS